MTIITRIRYMKIYFYCICVCFLSSCEDILHFREEKILVSQQDEWVMWTDLKRDTLTLSKVCNVLLKKNTNSYQAKAVAYLGFSNLNELKNEPNLNIATAYADSAIKLATKHDFNRELGFAYLQKADIAYLNKDMDEMFKYLEKLKAFYENRNLNEKRLLCDYYLRQGLYYRSIQDHRLAIDDFNKSISLAKENKYYQELAFGLFCVSWVHSESSMYREALEYVSGSIDILHKNFPEELGNMYYEQSLVLLNLKRYTEAEKAILLAKDYFVKYKTYSKNEGVVNNILGDVYVGQSELDKAKHHYDIAIDKVKGAVHTKWLYASLARFYEQSGQDKNASKYWNKYHIIKDSLFSIQHIVDVKNMESRYLKEEEQYKSSQQQIKYMGIVFLLLVVMLIVVVYVFFYIRHTNLKVLLATIETNLKQTEIDSKQRELASTMLWQSQQIEQKKDIINQLEKLYHLAEGELKKNLGVVIKQLANNTQNTQEWDNFKLHFEAVSPAFFEKLKSKAPNLTDLDLKHCAYIKINLTTKQVAQILGISSKSVTLFRVRLKKKLHLDEDTSLSDFLRSI